MNSDKEPVYLISQVSKMLDIHPQTLRQYEKEDLIKPSRLNSRIRLYCNDDIKRIKKILNLTRDLGVNLAGVDLILRYQERIKELQDELKDCKVRFSHTRIDSNTTVVPTNKALIVKKSSYCVITVDN